MYVFDDTIVAISSAAGIGARGIIRLSGPDAFAVIDKIFQCDKDNINDTPSWTVLPGRCRLPIASGAGPASSVTCPAQLYIFRTPHSYTTQDMAELHLPGSPVLLPMVLESILSLGTRSAEPGEFTARAFFNGRIDLTEAEAVAALINARGDGQLRAAERLLDGQLHHLCHRLTQQLGDVLALVEAGIDFSEEEIEFVTPDQLRRQIETVREYLDDILRRSVSWDELNHLPRVAVAGPANAGKSSLVNALLGIDRSIVSPIAGTTRDLLTAPLSLSHGECLLIDTAGLGDVADPLADKTQHLTSRAIAGCDLLLWVFDASDTESSGSSIAGPTMPPGRLKQPAKIINVANKIDLCPARPIARAMSISQDESISTIAVSALCGNNLEVLKCEIGRVLSDELSVDIADGAIALTTRHRQALQDARQSLEQALSLLTGAESFQLELLGLELRLALDDLGSISGQVENQDVLDRIFSRFCIGK